MRGYNLGIVLKITIITFVVYLLVLIIPGLIFKYAVFPLFKKDIYFFFLGLLLLLADLWVLMLCAIIFPGVCWRMLNLRFSGVHPLDLSVRDVRNWVLTHMIYLPTAVVLDFFHFYPLKAIHVWLFGGRIGKNVVMGGLVLDPSKFEVGDDTVVGGFSTILGHAVERGNIIYGKVTIGKKCGVGIRSLILPGAKLNDGSMLGAQSLLAKNIEVPKNETYAGVPAKKISIHSHCPNENFKKTNGY